MPNLEILKTVSSFKPGDVVSDTDVQLLGATPEDWINVGAARRTDKERSDDLDVFHVAGTREHAARLDAEAVKRHEADKATAERATAATARNLAAKNAATAADGKPGKPGKTGTVASTEPPATPPSTEPHTPPVK